MARLSESARGVSTPDLALAAGMCGCYDPCLALVFRARRLLLWKRMQIQGEDKPNRHSAMNMPIAGRCYQDCGGEAWHLAG